MVAAAAAAASSSSPLDVQPLKGRVSGPLGANVSLTCLASSKPVLCLWKTPYGHIYTLSEGVSAESGRIRHVPVAGGGFGCSLNIDEIKPKDAGEWECEIGAVVNEDFQTRTAYILHSVAGQILLLSGKVPSPNFIFSIIQKNENEKEMSILFLKNRCAVGMKFAKVFPT